MIECPVKCKYCMASKIDCRSTYWNNGSRIGINKSCVFINRLPDDPPLSEMSFDWELFEGDYLGFQGITDCFWVKYFDDLKWLINKVENSKIRKLVLTSKIPINQKQLDILKQTKKILVVYSLTGLDLLENTKTIDRIKSMVKLKEAGIDTFGVIHPYIHNYSDLSFLKELSNNGFEFVSYKGFRYNPNNMSELKKYVPLDILNQYKHDEDEILIGKNYLDEQLSKYNLKYIELRKYIRKNNNIFIEMDKEEVIRQTDKLLSISTISSSEKDYQILRDDIINRRLKGE